MALDIAHPEPIPWNLPCPRCGSYRTKQSTRRRRVELRTCHCEDCGRLYETVDLSFRLGAEVPAAYHAFPDLSWRLRWLFQAEGELRHECVICPNWMYRSWVLGWVTQVNLFQSGYWLLIGTPSVTLSGAKDEAERFRRFWRDWLCDEEFVARKRLPKGMLGTFRERFPPYGGLATTHSG